MVGEERPSRATRISWPVVREYGAVLAVLVVIIVAYLFATGRLSLSPSHPTTDQLAPAGESLVVDEGWAPLIPFAGTLEVSFAVTNGSAELCVTPWDTWTDQPSPQCPSNATYDSGLVKSGTMSVAVGAGTTVWLVVLGYPGYNGDDPPVALTFTTPLFLVPSN